MTHEARSMSGIILISVPTIRYGGCFLLTCLITRVTVHGESASSKFLPGGTCPCRRDCDSVPRFSDSRGRGRSFKPLALVRSNGFLNGGCGCSAPSGYVLSLGRALYRRSYGSDLRRESDGVIS